MEFTVGLYDSEGNEIELKPGHALVMGKNAMAQVPMEQYEAKFVYKPPNDSSRAEKLIAEWGSSMPVMFPSISGSFKRWEDLNETIHDGDARDSE